MASTSLPSYPLYASYLPQGRRITTPSPPSCVEQLSFSGDSVPLRTVPVQTLSAYTLPKVRFSAIQEKHQVDSKVGGKLDCRCFSMFLREPRLIRLLPGYLNKRYPQGAPIKIYGCADGSEAYGLAMMLIKKLGPKRAADFPITATDIVPAMVEMAKTGVLKLTPEEITRYEKDLLLTQRDFERHGREFPPGFNALMEPLGSSNMFKVSDLVKQLITFQSADLLEDAQSFEALTTISSQFSGELPAKQRPLIVIARNVWNQFSPEKRRKTAKGLREHLPPRQHFGNRRKG